MSLRSRGAGTFVCRGGEEALAITRERKEQLVAEYTEQIKESEGIILTQED